MGTTPLTASFLNRKGGVGKTSSVFHFSGSFARAGHRCLVCDVDPQSSLTQGFFGPRFVEELPKSSTVAALFDDSFDPDPDELIRPTAFENIWIVPASNHLNDHNTPRPEESGEQQSALRDFLSEVKDRFDVILIDCPPNLLLCSHAALLASDFVVVPVIPEDFSSQGLIYVQQAIDAAMTTRNPKLRLLGYVLTSYNRQLGIHKAYEKLLREQYEDLVFENVMPLVTAFKEAVARRRPIAEDKPKSAAAEAIDALCREILERAPVLGEKPAEFYYAGNRYVPGLAEPQGPAVAARAVDAEEGT
jgi:chromosome partitioning protein